MKVRNALESDIPRLSELLSLLFRQESEFEANDTVQRRALLKIITGPETGQILVLEKNDLIIGMINLLFTISTHEGGPAALLEDFIIDPDFRSIGGGTILLEKAIEILKEKKISRITLLTDNDNESAKKLYRKFGFIHSPMEVMRLILPL